MTRAATRLVTILPTLLLAATAAGADDDRGGRSGVPGGHLPPPGHCRVWYDGVPPGRQPPPTDCVTAQRQAARTRGRVVYGADPGRGRDHDRWDDDDRWEDDWDDDDRWDDRRDGRDWRDRDRREDRGRGRGDTRYGDCSDRDWRRGACDDLAYRCVDRDRNGRCDGAPGGRRRALPEMIWATRYSRGRLVPELQGWLPGPGLGVRLSDRDRNGWPEDVVWLARAGRIVQRWRDLDRDGRADRVELYRNGRVWRVLR